MDSFTHSQNSHNSSLFSCDYKIPKHYHDQDSQSIVEHLQQSQNQLHFIKIKLEQAYRKLEQQIKQNAELQENNTFLTNNIQQLTTAIELQKRQNYKLKQVLEKILENRKMLQDELQATNQQHKKKLQVKQAQLDQLRKNHQRQIQKIRNQHNEQIEDIYQQHRKGIKTFQRDLEYKYETKIANLQKEIEKVINEKILQTGRLKHQISCYQIQQFGNSILGTNPPTSRVYEVNNRQASFDFPKKKRDRRQFNQYREFQSGTSLGSHLQQNSNQCNHNIPRNIVATTQILKQQQQNRVGKWRKSPSVSTLKDSNSRSLTDDQQLSEYQIRKKKVECQLSKLDRIKRPSNQDRQKLQGLEKELYDLDSKIAGLKRKIRRKY